MKVGDIWEVCKYQDKDERNEK